MVRVSWRNRLMIDRYSCRDVEVEDVFSRVVKRDDLLYCYKGDYVRMTLSQDDVINVDELKKGA